MKLFKLQTLLIIALILIVVMGSYFVYRAQQDSSILVLDSFEGTIKGGEDATVDYGSGAGAKVSVGAVKDPVYHGRQSLKIVYDVSGGGYIWVARGYNLSQKNAGQWERRPEKIDWTKYSEVLFYINGQANGNNIALNLIDDGREYHRVMITDDTKGWKEISIPINTFVTRTDWQPDFALRNEKIDFPIKAFQFEPKTGLGVIYIDKVCLTKGEIKNK